MLLTGLPKRPNKTTRLLLKLQYISRKECRITVKDLGLEKCSLPAEKNGKKSYSGKGGESLSGYILCQTKTADSPYFIENISTNIYTLEELCYYLFHNLYLIDDTVMNERLCLWLQDELNLPGLPPG